MQSVIPCKTIFVELTNACNFDCTFCPNYLMTRPLGMMDFELFKKIIADSRACGVQRFNLWLMGEPFLHPHCFDFIRYAKENNMKLSLISNGGVLGQIGFADEFFSLPFSGDDDILVSFLTPNSCSFRERKARGVNFENYQEGVFKFIGKKFEKKSSLGIILIYVINIYTDVLKVPGMISSATEVLDTLSELSEFAASLKKELGIDFSFSMPTLKHMEEEIKSFRERKIEFLPGVFFNLKWLTNWGKVILPDGLKVVPSRNGYCAYPFESLGILWNGDVTLCCDDYNGELVVGNLKEKTLQQVFYSEKASRIRQALKKGILLMPRCQVCQGKVVDQEGKALRSYYKKYYLSRAWRHLRVHGLKKTIKKILAEIKI